MTRALAQRLAADPATGPPPPQEIGKGTPGPGRGKKTGSVRTRLSVRGETVEYLVRRLKRDAPAAVAAMSAQRLTRRTPEDLFPPGFPTFAGLPLPSLMSAPGGYYPHATRRARFSTWGKPVPE